MSWRVHYFCTIIAYAFGQAHTQLLLYLETWMAQLWTSTPVIQDKQVVAGSGLLLGTVIQLALTLGCIGRVATLGT